MQIQDCELILIGLPTLISLRSRNIPSKIWLSTILLVGTTSLNGHPWRERSRRHVHTLGFGRAILEALRTGIAGMNLERSNVQLANMRRVSLESHPVGVLFSTRTLATSSFISRNKPLIQFPNANQFPDEAQNFSDQGCSRPVY